MTTEPNNDLYDQRQIAQEIAQALGETEPAPIRQIERLVRVLGADPTQALLQETLEVETAGGMLTDNGARRRTPGGMFFKLAPAVASTFTTPMPRT